MCLYAQDAPIPDKYQKIIDAEVDLILAQERERKKVQKQLDKDLTLLKRMEKGTIQSGMKDSYIIPADESKEVFFKSFAVRRKLIQMGRDSADRLESQLEQLNLPVRFRFPVLKLPLKIGDVGSLPDSVTLVNNNSTLVSADRNLVFLEGSPAVFYEVIGTETYRPVLGTTETVVAGSKKTAGTGTTDTAVETKDNDKTGKTTKKKTEKKTDSNTTSAGKVTTTTIGAPRTVSVVRAFDLDELNRFKKKK